MNFGGWSLREANLPTLYKLSVLTVGFLLSLFIAEILLKIFWTPSYLDPRFERDDLEWTKGNVVLNRFGYRDREFDLKKGQRYRIYSLGDSYTYGWYINDADKTYPKIIEKKLVDKYGQGIEVINASRPGFNLKESVIRFKQEGILFSPDLVTLGINIFDITNQEFSPYYIKNDFIRSLRLYQLTFGNRERVKVSRRTKDLVDMTYQDGSPQLKNAQESLQEIKRLVDSIGSRLVLIIFPAFNPANPNENYGYHLFNRQIEKLGTALGINIVDLYEPFSKHSDKGDLILNPTDAHPSELAHQIAADYLVNTLNFDSLLSSPRATNYERTQLIYSGIKLENFHGIMSTNLAGWVYFNDEFRLGTQKLFLPESQDRQILYLEDSLKTAKSFTHAGWPGAKIDYYFPGGSKTLKISTTLFGFKVVGVYKITGFANENKSLVSWDLGLSQASVKRDAGNVLIDIKDNKDYSLYKIGLDVFVKQFDITDGIVGSIFTTKIYSRHIYTGDDKFLLIPGSKIGSLPQFFQNGVSREYVWINNNLTLATMKKQDNNLEVLLDSPPAVESIVEFPLAVGYNNATFPFVTYK